jgi:HSP20 family molecular chaperone IbpA
MILAPHLQSTGPWLNDLNHWFDFAFRDLVSERPRDLRIREHDGGHVLELDLPGVSRDEVTLERHQRQLVVHLRKDREDGRKLELPLSPKVDVNRIEADLKLGVLRVTLPKAETEQDTATIEIR